MQKDNYFDVKLMLIQIVSWPKFSISILQGDAIKLILSGKHVVLNVPTGGGKSFPQMAANIFAEGEKFFISILKKKRLKPKSYQRRFSSCFNQQTHVCQCSASTYIYSWKLLLWSRFNCEINNSNTPELNVGNGTGGTLMAVLAQIWSELREKYFPDFGHFGWLDQMQILHWEKYKHSAKQILPRFWAPGEVVL